MDIREELYSIIESARHLKPEMVLATGVLALVILAFFKRKPAWIDLTATAFIFLITGLLVISGSGDPVKLFGAMAAKDSFSDYLKVLLDLSGLLTCLMSADRSQVRSFRTEYCLLLLAVVFGGHFFLMSNNLLLTFLSIEIISISSYLLAGFAFNRKSSEGSLKYFLFGSVSSAIMIYGFTLLYGLTGTLDFSQAGFSESLLTNNNEILLLAGALSLGGFLFKIAAAPMHIWAPDVYESAPLPVIAFLSVVPKLAGAGALAKFILAINVYGQTGNDWQLIVAGIAILTITVGNFAALKQSSPRRMMAFSSIAQSGFLLVGLAAFLLQGLHFMLFYATIYILMNFIVFIYLAYFERRNIFVNPDYAGTGKTYPIPALLLLTGLIALTGLPPTAGFTGKLLLFTSLWQSYELSGKYVLLWLLVFGLLNTVISLFFYLRIPYYAFLKEGQSGEKQNFIVIENLLGVILVLLVLALFFVPGLLMGWINKVNFVF